MMWVKLQWWNFPEMEWGTKTQKFTWKHKFPQHAKSENTNSHYGPIPPSSSVKSFEKIYRHFCELKSLCWFCRDMLNIIETLSVWICISVKLNMNDSWSSICWFDRRAQLLTSKPTSAKLWCFWHHSLFAAWRLSIWLSAHYMVVLMHKESSQVF